MPATVSIVVRHKAPTPKRPNPAVVTIGEGDIRLLLAALRAAPTPTVADLERAQDLIDLLSSVE